MTLKEAIQKDGQRHLYVKSAVTSETIQQIQSHVSIIFYPIFIFLSFFSLPRSLMNFLNRLASGVYLILISLFYTNAENFLIDSQFILNQSQKFIFFIKNIILYLISIYFNQMYLNTE